MAIRIAKINAVAAARPVRAAFDRDTGLVEALFPNLPFFRSDGKSHVDRTVTVMRRNRAAGQVHGLQRMAAKKQQQHAAMADVVSAQPWVAIDAVQPKHLLVERTSALERLDIEHCFQDAE